MSKKLFVGSLSYQTDENGLRDAFAQAGEVTSVMIPTDRFSGRSRGFGFVEMATDEDAQKAVEMWHGKDLDGRTINVDEARPQADRGSRGPRNDRPRRDDRSF